MRPSQPIGYISQYGAECLREGRDAHIYHNSEGLNDFVPVYTGVQKSHWLQLTWLRNNEGVYSLERTVFSLNKIDRVARLPVNDAAAAIKRFRDSEYYLEYMCSDFKDEMLVRFARNELAAIWQGSKAFYCLTTVEEVWSLIVAGGHANAART